MKKTLKMLFWGVLLLGMLYYLPFPKANVHALITSEFDKFGSFSMVNTTESEELVSTSHTTTWIGTTWNLTVSVDINSSSGINVTFYNKYIVELDPQKYSKWWEGSKGFVVNPDKTHSEIYVSHGLADFPLEPMFYITLVESEQNASGQYQLTLLERGYRADIDLAGETYISDITAWLKESSSTIPGFNISIESIVIPIVIAILVDKHRR